MLWIWQTCYSSLPAWNDITGFCCQVEDNFCLAEAQLLQHLINLGVEGNSGVREVGPLPGHELSNQIPQGIRLDAVPWDSNSFFLAFRLSQVRG
jgi:hypothetical protein